MGKLREMAGKYPKYYRLQLGPVPVVILSSPETVEVISVKVSCIFNDNIDEKTCNSVTFEPVEVALIK